ncbi:MAG: hypothetical protein A2V83_04220 [Nitrospirae bacterium RBG_16_64_22]|nr:MAG: hypothetical protein A2V83_04220 [Nitrospirae bacterium RBG_16_64_22]
MEPFRKEIGIAHVLGLALVLLFAGGPAEAAQKKGHAKPERKGYKLVLKQIPELNNGKTIAVEGEADSMGDRFLVENLFILQPVAVTVLARNKGDDVRIRLAKDRWDEPIEEKSTKGVGRQTIKFRTQGDLRIIISSPKGKVPYNLLVWAGDEVKPDMKSVFKAPAKRGGRLGSAR